MGDLREKRAVPEWLKKFGYPVLFAFAMMLLLFQTTLFGPVYLFPDPPDFLLMFVVYCSIYRGFVPGAVFILVISYFFSIFTSTPPGITSVVSTVVFLAVKIFSRILMIDRILYLAALVVAMSLVQALVQSMMLRFFEYNQLQLGWMLFITAKVAVLSFFASIPVFYTLKSIDRFMGASEEDKPEGGGDIILIR